MIRPAVTKALTDLGIELDECEICKEKALIPVPGTTNYWYCGVCDARVRDMVVSAERSEEDNGHES